MKHSRLPLRPPHLPMPRLRSKGLVWLGAALLLAGCDAAPDAPVSRQTPAPTEKLGLMTSLPLYWPLGEAIGDIAAGRGAIPWQRSAMASAYVLELIDTLSPIPGLSPDAPEVDPLADLDRLAVVQPRGLSPGDNVALDAWVRKGGRLLLVLDPALTGDYDLPLGDPRRPVDSALIPPVVARWGMAVNFDEAQDAAATTAPLGNATLPWALAGRIAVNDPAAADCTLLAGGAAAQCRVGEGQVTLIADAALFEHQELAGKDGAGLRDVLAFAFP